MRKEIFIAIIAGIAVGLLVAFGAWRANSALKTNTVDLPLPSTKKNETPEVSEETKKPTLSLVSIEDFDVITESPFKITGITKPLSIVTISGESEDYIIKSNEDGTFEQNVNLEAGVNQILFKVIDENRDIAEQKIIAVFSSEFEKDLSGI